jgi:RIO kinase 2
LQRLFQYVLGLVAEDGTSGSGGEEEEEEEEDDDEDEERDKESGREEESEEEQDDEVKVSRIADSERPSELPINQTGHLDLPLYLASSSLSHHTAQSSSDPSALADDLEALSLAQISPQREPEQPNVQAIRDIVSSQVSKERARERLKHHSRRNPGQAGRAKGSKAKQDVRNKIDVGGFWG